MANEKPNELKDKALELLAMGASPSAVAAELNVSRSQIYEWKYFGVSFETARGKLTLKELIDSQKEVLWLQAGIEALQQFIITTPIRDRMAFMESLMKQGLFERNDLLKFFLIDHTTFDRYLKADDKRTSYEIRHDIVKSYVESYYDEAFDFSSNARYLIHRIKETENIRVSKGYLKKVVIELGRKIH